MATVVNVKVKNIRPAYSTLSDWMADPRNEYIGRGGVVFIDKERFPKKASPWANPFTVKQHGRDTCLALYEGLVRERIQREGTGELKKLKGKVLGCWCAPEACHGDVLVRILNEIAD